MYLEIFLADFVVFRVFLGISRDFAGPRPREISEALTLGQDKQRKLPLKIMYVFCLSCPSATFAL